MPLATAEMNMILSEELLWSVSGEKYLVNGFVSQGSFQPLNHHPTDLTAV